MAIYRNEELLVGNHIAIPEFKDFKGRIVAYGKIRRVIPKAYMFYTIVELTMENENHFYLSKVSDFKTFKNICPRIGTWTSPSSLLQSKKKILEVYTGKI